MSKKILIVDDETFIRSLLEQILEDLEDEGVELFFAENGEEGLRKIKEEVPDLVFLDVMMPKMNGFEVCEAVRKDAAVSSTYIILLTAKGQQADKFKGEEVKANEYITKPFDPDLILEKATSILGIS